MMHNFMTVVLEYYAGVLFDALFLCSLALPDPSYFINFVAFRQQIKNRRREKWSAGYARLLIVLEIMLE